MGDRRVPGVRTAAPAGDGPAAAVEPLATTTVSVVAAAIDTKMANAHHVASLSPSPTEPECSRPAVRACGLRRRLIRRDGSRLPSGANGIGGSGRRRRGDGRMVDGGGRGGSGGGGTRAVPPRRGVPRAQRRSPPPAVAPAPPPRSCRWSPGTAPAGRSPRDRRRRRRCFPSIRRDRPARRGELAATIGGAVARQRQPEHLHVAGRDGPRRARSPRPASSRSASPALITMIARRRPGSRRKWASAPSSPAAKWRSPSGRSPARNEKLAESIGRRGLERLGGARVDAELSRSCRWRSSSIAGACCLATAAIGTSAAVSSTSATSSWPMPRCSTPIGRVPLSSRAAKAAGASTCARQRSGDGDDDGRREGLTRVDRDDAQDLRRRRRPRRGRGRDRARHRARRAPPIAPAWLHR